MDVFRGWDDFYGRLEEFISQSNSIVIHKNFNYIDFFFRFGLLTITKKFHGLQNVLSKFYPDYKWNEGDFKNIPMKKAQNALFQVVRELFVGADIHTDYIHPKMNYNSQVGRNMELDIFIPSLNIAFGIYTILSIPNIYTEFQGAQHYPEIVS